MAADASERGIGRPRVMKDELSMAARASLVNGMPLVRKLRRALGQPDGEVLPASPRPAALRRDVGGLLDRLDRLRDSFPEAAELLARVELSPHVIGLLHDANGLETLRVEGRRGR
jgi:hypothetical protein